jgi:hypothetical protein
MKELLRQWREYDRRQVVILTYVPIALAVLEYFFVSPRSAEAFAFIRNSRWAVLPFLWYNLGCLVFMLAFPMAIAWLFGDLSPRESGLKVRGTLRDAPVYVVLFLLCLPMIVWASRQSGFAATYPIFSPPKGNLMAPDYLLFEASYFLQFLAVEYFFRGFMTLGLKPTLGRASVLAMLPPYCMIHFHKPFPEALAAIGAGFILGTLSWRNGTVIWGWMLHYAVGISMNILAHVSSHAPARDSLKF